MPFAEVGLEFGTVLFKDTEYSRFSDRLFGSNIDEYSKSSIGLNFGRRFDIPANVKGDFQFGLRYNLGIEKHD